MNCRKSYDAKEINALINESSSTFMGTKGVVNIYELDIHIQIETTGRPPASHFQTSKQIVTTRRTSKRCEKSTTFLVFFFSDSSTHVALWIISKLFFAKTGKNRIKEERMRTPNPIHKIPFSGWIKLAYNERMYWKITEFALIRFQMDSEKVLKKKKELHSSKDKKHALLTKWTLWGWTNNFRIDQSLWEQQLISLILSRVDKIPMASSRQTSFESWNSIYKSLSCIKGTNCCWILIQKK